MVFELNIPTPEGATRISLSTGSSIIFVGANGSGKTRLAVRIENLLGSKAHRISAHRALSLNPNIHKISESSALRGLKFGHQSTSIGIEDRTANRWNSDQSIALLDDFDFVVQALFAEQSNRSLKSHKRARQGDAAIPEPTHFEKLINIWNSLLPHRTLHISGDDIEVSAIDSDKLYGASQLSDGERAIFYLIAQILLASDDSIVIIDEPELHVHRSIMSRLWDELEAARQDCAFIFITHDLEFASYRAAQKWIIKNHDYPRKWSIEPVPVDTGFDEETVTLILGSRRPILFVEGGQTSLDLAIYRCCFPDWTVIPKGSCEDVIHSVVTMRRNARLTRVTCSGIVDADDHDTKEAERLRGLGVAVLPVSEIENLIILPSISREIAASEGFKNAELESKLADLKSSIFATLESENAVNDVVMRYARRRIDKFLKKIDLSGADSMEEMKNEYANKVSSLEIEKIAESARGRIQWALANDDLPMLLANYDNKGLFALAATHLKKNHRDAFEDWLVRVLRNNTIPNLTKAIREALPVIEPQ